MFEYIPESEFEHRCKLIRALVLSKSEDAINLASLSTRIDLKAGFVLCSLAGMTA